MNKTEKQVEKVYSITLKINPKTVMNKIKLGVLVFFVLMLLSLIFTMWVLAYRHFGFLVFIPLGVMASYILSAMINVILNR